MGSMAPAPDESLLKHRAFVAFWLARTCSSFGFQMFSVAISWQIYALTNSAMALGMIGLMQYSCARHSFDFSRQLGSGDCRPDARWFALRRWARHHLWCFRCLLSAVDLLGRPTALRAPAADAPANESAQSVRRGALYPRA